MIIWPDPPSYETHKTAKGKKIDKIKICIDLALPRWAQNFVRLNFGRDDNKNCLSNSKLVQMRANAYCL